MLKSPPLPRHACYINKHIMNVFSSISRRLCILFYQSATRKHKNRLDNQFWKAQSQIWLCESVAKGESWFTKYLMRWRYIWGWGRKRRNQERCIQQVQVEVLVEMKGERGKKEGKLGCREWWMREGGGDEDENKKNVEW